MAKGRKTGGRTKGVPNHVTAEVRAVFKAIFDRLAPEAEGWIRGTADEDPGKAADLLLRLAEFHIPKLSRADVTVTIQSLTEEQILDELRRREAEEGEE